MKPFFLPLLTLAAACSGTAGKRADGASLGCATITGAQGVAIVSRSDPTTLLATTAPDSIEGAAASVAGPDASGQFYLAEPDGSVKVSDDGGCSWKTVGALVPDVTRDTGLGGRYAAAELFVGPGSNRVYAYYEYDRLMRSEDGADWVDVSVQDFPTPADVVIDPTDSDVLRGYAREAIVTSRDGGQTWTTSSVPDPDTWYTPAIDRDDLDRIALSRDGLWVSTDAATWDQRNGWLNAHLAWDSGDLYAAFYGPDDAALHIQRYADAGTAAYELPADTDPYAHFSRMAVDRGLVVLGGFRYPTGGEATALVQFTTEAGTTADTVDGYGTVWSLALGDDRVLVGLENL